MSVAEKQTTMAARVAKACRGRGAAVRSVYLAARRAAHAGSFLARRRAVRAVRPPANLAIPDDRGYRLLPPGTFDEADQAVTAARQLLERSGEVLEARRKTRGSKQFLVNLLDSASLTHEHPAVRLALRPDVLAAVVAYMGTVPVLRTIQVFYSGAVDREPISSQLYHCDADDMRQMKIFVLCSDVRPENGPLTLLDAARSDRVRRASGYAYNDRLSDEQVAAIVGADGACPVVGAPGTTCFVDTSRCFHYGSRVEAGAAPRLVLMVQYLSPFAFVLPGDWRAGAALAHLASDALTPLQRAVLTGDDRSL